MRGGPLNVTAVVEKARLSQALVSKHLKLLTIAGVVQRRPEGSLVFYAVNDNAVFKLMAQAEKLLLASRRQQLDAVAARDQRACIEVNTSPALDGFPNPPDHHRQDDPWQQGPEQHNSH